MLAVHMETGSHLKRAWEDDTHYQNTESRYVGQLVGPHILSPHHRHPAPAPNHTLPPIVTAADISSRPSIERFPSGSGLSNVSLHDVHGHSASGSPSKRPRVYHSSSYQADSVHSQSPAHGATPPAQNNHYENRSPYQWPPRGSQSHESIHLSPDGCHACAGSKEVVDKVVVGLERLEAELRQVLASSPLSRAPKEETRGPEPGLRGSLQGTLLWASHSIEASTRLVREFAASQRALPRITVDNLGIPPAHEQPSAITSAPPDFSRGFMDKNNDRERMKDAHRRLGPQYHGEYQLRPPDTVQLPPSPHPTASSSSVYGQSPLGMGGPARMLPSPSSLHTASSVQGGFSPSSNQSAQTSHMQDLQHQISTKSLALTTLQREHDQLLAAYSRMQVRCQTLDKKSQVSDHEINTITEDKLRLQAQADALEIQVDELIRARDDAQKQTTASGAQYMQIMSMSSKLQAHGAEEARRYKTEREDWERDRNGLQDRIQMLESGSSAQLLTPSIEFGQPQSFPAVEDVLGSTSLDVLRNEVVRLRQSLMAMERKFIDLGQETKRLDQVIEECTGIRERLATKTMVALPHPPTTISRVIRLAKSISPVNETRDTFMIPDEPNTNTSAEQEAKHETDHEIPMQEVESGTFLITESGDDSIL